MSVYVVREGEGSCPYGCADEIVIVKCLPSDRLVGWCSACECSMPIPLPDDYKMTGDDIAMSRYAPEGAVLPDWAELVARGMTEHVIREIAAEQWYGLTPSQ